MGTLNDLGLMILDSNSFTPTWTDTNTDETSVEVWRQDPTVANPYLLSSLAAGTTTYTDTSLTGGTQYTYLVRSVRNDAYALFSSDDTFTTPAGDGECAKLQHPTVAKLHCIFVMYRKWDA